LILIKLRFARTLMKTYYGHSISKATSLNTSSHFGQGPIKGDHGHKRPHPFKRDLGTRNDHVWVKVDLEPMYSMGLFELDNV